ncbi:MAG: AAA family ATPase, partial [Elusimicrobiota bacterium]
MLRSLIVRNFAIISELEIAPGAGLNVFTGETGAGKSILIEALGFLLGARASASWLRQGSSRMSVEGSFDAEDLPAALRGGLRPSAGTVIFRRELDASGKTRASVDGQPLTNAALAALGEGLVDFHGQHEHQTLLKNSVQLDSLDAYAGLEKQRGQLAGWHRAWTEAAAGLSAARMSDAERQQRIGFDRFQLQEIDAAKLRPGEEEALEADLPLLKNADRIRNLADTAYGLLYAAEDAALANLQKAQRAMDDLSRFDESLRSGRDDLESARAAVAEVARGLHALRERVDADPARLDSMIKRQDELARLKGKYGITVAAVLARREELAVELERLENSQKRIEDMEAALEAARRALHAACAKLHKARAAAARKFEAALLQELKVLGMPHAEFSVSVELEEDRYTAAGSDT